MPARVRRQRKSHILDESIPCDHLRGALRETGQGIGREGRQTPNRSAEDRDIFLVARRRRRYRLSLGGGAVAGEAQGDEKQAEHRTRIDTIRSRRKRQSRSLPSSLALLEGRRFARDDRRCSRQHERTDIATVLGMFPKKAERAA